jgi:hypothetical protein
MSGLVGLSGQTRCIISGSSLEGNPRTGLYAKYKKLTCRSKKGYKPRLNDQTTEKQSFPSRWPIMTVIAPITFTGWQVSPRTRTGQIPLHSDLCPLQRPCLGDVPMSVSVSMPAPTSTRSPSHPFRPPYDTAVCTRQRRRGCLAQDG